MIEPTIAEQIAAVRRAIETREHQSQVPQFSYGASADAAALRAALAALEASPERDAEFERLRSELRIERGWCEPHQGYHRNYKCEFGAGAGGLEIRLIGIREGRRQMREEALRRVVAIHEGKYNSRDPAVVDNACSRIHLAIAAIPDDPPTQEPPRCPSASRDAE